MLSREEEAYLEGAKNLWRFNRGDLFNVCVYAGIIVALLALGWLAHWAFVLAFHPWHFNPCGTLNPGCH